ncbi:MAG: DsbC family protein [Gammaproteobacteria bacterium]|nr:DsbC family protein [Gammaproteobacteria bacterium]
MKKILTTLCLASITLGVGAAPDDVPDSVMEAARMVSPHGADAVRPAPLDGFYELVFGSRIVYVSEDGRYLLVGQLYDTREGKNLTDQRMNGIRLDMINGVAGDSMIRFAPDKPRHEVYVFTDTRCGYCRKLHDEVSELNALGVAVNYLAYPALSPRSRPDAIAVWCADDRQAAMTRAKTGKTVEPQECAHPVDEHFRLGKAMGVRGTPAIVLETGELLPGYVPARKLAQQLEQGGG